MPDTIAITIFAVVSLASGGALWAAWTLGRAGRGKAYFGLLIGGGILCLLALSTETHEILGWPASNPLRSHPRLSAISAEAGAMLATLCFYLQARRIRALIRATEELERECNRLVSAETHSLSSAP